MSTVTRVPTGPTTDTRRNGAFDRQPPHSVEMEKGVLSSMMVGGRDVIAHCAQKISAGHFFVSTHRTIFSVLVEMCNADQKIDLLTFTEELRNRKLLDGVGGAAAVTELQTLTAELNGFVPTAANVQYYLDSVREKYALRELIAFGTETVRRAYEEQADVAETLEFAKEKLEALPRPQDDLPAATDIMTLSETDPTVFEADNLLGNRFLCREGGMLFIGPSGIGKSSASIQQDILWALGRPAFGIKPARPLRMLTIQAENDDGDLAEMTRGVCDHLNLSAQDRAEVKERVVLIKEKATTGENFVRLARQLVRKYRSDIVRIDPFQAYAGGDVREPAVTTPFLRNGLNRILEEFRCGAILNHHTPKTNYRDTSEWKASDWMYAGAGNADITNWARAILVIDATRAHGAFIFRAAKRGSRVGWADEDGHPVYDRLFCHYAGDAIFWRDATEEDEARVALAKKGQAPKTKEELKALVPFDKPIPKNALLERARLSGFPINPTRALLAELIRTEELYEWRVPRKGTNPEVLISRKEQTLI